MGGAQFIAKGEDSMVRRCDQRGPQFKGVAERDYLTIEGAAELAARITAYWREHTLPGQAPVLCTIEREAFGKSGHTRQPKGDGRFSLVVVRSNLVAGMPPR